MNHIIARNLAEFLILDLHPGWARIEIAGSVRRGKPEVKDLELVAIASVESQECHDLFDQVVSVTLADRLEDRLRDLLEPEAGWTWRLDEDLPRNGPHYKRLQHKALGICCDLFITDERGWGGAMAIRTGPADFSQALVTLALHQGKHVADGYLIHGHPKTPHPCADYAKGKLEKLACSRGPNCPLIIPTLEEADFFAALGLPFWDPAGRTAELVWKKAKMEAAG